MRQRLASKSWSPHLLEQSVLRLDFHESTILPHLSPPAVIITLANKLIYRIWKPSNIIRPGIGKHIPHPMIEDIEASCLDSQPTIRVEFEEGILKLDRICGTHGVYRAIPPRSKLEADSRFFALTILLNSTRKALETSPQSTAAQALTTINGVQSELDLLWNDVYRHTLRQIDTTGSLEQSQAERAYKCTRELICKAARIGAESALRRLPLADANVDQNQIRRLASLALARMEVMVQINDDYSHDPLFEGRKEAWNACWKSNNLTTSISKPTIKSTIATFILSSMLDIFGDSRVLNTRELPSHLDSRDHPRELSLSDLPSDSRVLFQADLLGRNWRELGRGSERGPGHDGDSYVWATDWDIATEYAWNAAWQIVYPRQSAIQNQATQNGEASERPSKDKSYSTWQTEAWERAYNSLKQNDRKLDHLAEEEWQKLTTGSIILGKLSYDSFLAKEWKNQFNSSLGYAWKRSWDASWMTTWEQSFRWAAKKGREYKQADERNLSPQTTIAIIQHIETMESYKTVKEKILDNFYNFLLFMSSLNNRFQANRAQDPMFITKGNSIKIHALVSKTKETRLDVYEILFQPNSWQRLSYRGLQRWIRDEKIAKRHQDEFYTKLAEAWNKLMESE